MMASESMAGAIVRQTDHVYVPLDDAKAAVAFLTQVLNLPEAWPYSDYGFFGSGGVCLGNVNLEALQGNDFPGGRPRHPARITGIAFEPAIEIDELMTALDARGISQTQPMPYVPRGGEEPFWTNVGFDVMEGTFVCKYHFDVAARRKQLKDELQARGGGPLGIVAAEEIVIGVRDIERSFARWSRLLDPIAPSTDRVWRVGGGPAIRLVLSSEDRVEHLVVGISSIEAAEDAARTLGIDGAETDEGISMAPEQVGGLVFQVRAPHGRLNQTSTATRRP